MVTGYTGGTPEQFPQRYAAVASDSYIRAGAPRTLIFITESDHLVPVSSMQAFEKRAKAAGIDVRSVKIPYGGHVFDAAGISGYRRDRSCLLQLLADVRAGRVDLAVCEALDRIARDGKDISWLGKKLRFDRVRLVTSTEGEIDEVKLAVAGLLGSMFLTNLKKKTLRGMKAAVLVGRIAGAKTYAYRRVVRYDERGTPVRGAFEIDDELAPIVRRIHSEFAADRSTIDIAKGLNADGIPSPRGGEWGASTIRGDPKKFTGILNNPLHRGILIWGRREWRRDSDSERRYRMRDEAKWGREQMPDPWMVDEALVASVDAEFATRALPQHSDMSRSNRKRHLLSGLIKCSKCGSNFTLTGKDYYRCVANAWPIGSAAHAPTRRRSVPARSKPPPSSP